MKPPIVWRALPNVNVYFFISWIHANTFYLVYFPNNNEVVFILNTNALHEIIFVQSPVFKSYTGMMRVNKSVFVIIPVCWIHNAITMDTRTVSVEKPAILTIIVYLHQLILSASPREPSFALRSLLPIDSRGTECYERSSSRCSSAQRISSSLISSNRFFGARIRTTLISAGICNRPVFGLSSTSTVIGSPRIAQICASDGWYPSFAIR